MRATGIGTPSTAPPVYGTLGWVRKQLRQATGDYGLTDQYALDANSESADRYINMALFYLDSRVRNNRLIREMRDYTLSSGNAYVEIPFTRSILGVHVVDEENGIDSYVANRLYHQLRAAYQEPWESMTVGQPLYWCRDEYLQSDPANMRVWMLPRAQQDYTVRVTAVWPFTRLSGIADKNVWTTRFPDLLVMAAHMEWARENGQTEAFTRMKVLVEEHIAGIHKDLTQEDVHGQLWAKTGQDSADATVAGSEGNAEEVL